MSADCRPSRNQDLMGTTGEYSSLDEAIRRMKSDLDLAVCMIEKKVGNTL